MIPNSQTASLGDVSYSSPLGGSVGRWLVHPVTRKAGLALLGTTGLALAVGFLSPHSSWLYAFLFLRGPIQWLIVATGCYGLVELAQLFRSGRQEAAGLERWRRGEPLEPCDGLLATCFQRIREAIAEAGLTDPREALREVVDEFESALNARYTTIETLIYVTPFVGLVGTLGGMSGGLRASFAQGGALDVTPFRTALSSSLENSFAAIGITVLLILLKQGLRARDAAVAAGAGRQALREVLSAERATARSLGLHNSAASPAAAHQLARAVDGIAQEVRGFSAQAAQLVKTVAATLSVVEGHKRDIAGDRQQLQSVVEGLAASVAKLAAGWDRSQLGLSAQTAQLQSVQAELARLAGVTSGIGQTVAGVGQAVTGVSHAVAEVRQAVDRPRVFELKAAN